eukprot:CAMPEP_0172308752 /NCGR_PEP_ID=MMETSP1058-20130122/9256_1 /TAXON_ID=83371 /ORGANISM="Detonula confervacea, Strain CCMP 353" /LENGTH=345 /DNA_ID=CAMNT_0013021245 /DNA_START=214 /DNA_END=1251 /DNA_ORIENTATION=-
MTNPWVESFLKGDFIFESRFLLYSLGYILVSLLGNWCHVSYHANPNSPPDARSLKALIASRPTVIAATIHSVATSVVAVGILIAYYNNQDSSSPWLYEGTNLLHIWQRVGLPISLSYFVTDSYFYCLPRKDMIIFVHHCIMCFCHYPVGHESGAILAGAGNVEWVTWLSIVGYTSEVSTAMMNYRWYLINTLEDNWIGFGIVNGIVVASWAGRVMMFTYLLFMEIFPRMHLYVEQQQMFTYAVMVFGHAGIGLLSLHWCIVMCQGGLKSLFVFKKKQRPKVLNPQQGFSFADEVGGKSNNEDTSGTERKTPHGPLKIIEEDAQAYKDGTIFSEGQTQTPQSKKLK